METENTALTSRRFQNDFDRLCIWTVHTQQLEGSLQSCDPRFRFLDPLVGALPNFLAKVLGLPRCALGLHKIVGSGSGTRAEIAAWMDSTLLFGMTFWCTFFEFSGFNGVDAGELGFPFIGHLADGGRGRMRCPGDVLYFFFGEKMQSWTRQNTPGT